LRRLPAGITRRPARTIGRDRLGGRVRYPQAGVRYRPADQICGNDPDVKPACGTPRVGCYTAGSFPPSILGQHRGTRTRARPLGRARGSINFRSRLGASDSKANKQSNNNQTYTVALEIREGSLAFAIEFTKDFLAAPVDTGCGYGRQGGRNTSIHRSLHTQEVLPEGATDPAVVSYGQCSHK
jgi:hypothetical protein